MILGFPLPYTATRVAAQNDFIFLWHGGKRVRRTTSWSKE
jgi:hypothetical protein